VALSPKDFIEEEFGMKRTFRLAAVMAGVLVAVASAPVSAQEGHPIKIGAILSVTGPASFLGAPEKKTLEMLVEKANASGGLLGRKIQLIIKDSESSPAKATSFAKQLIEEEGVLAIIGPSTSGESLAIKNLCEEGKTILISCAAAEKIVDPVAPHVFNVPQKDSLAARWIYNTMKDLGITRIGVLASNDGFGLAGKEQLQKYAPENQIEIAAAEVYDKAATDLTGVLTKLKAQKVEAIVNWSVSPAQALVAKNMKQLDFNVPLFQSHGFGNIKYVQAGGEASNGTIFPAGRLLVADQLPDGHPQKKLLLEYKKDYETRYGEDVSTFGGHAYDGFLVLSAAVKKAGSTDREKVRDAVEQLRDLPGTAGIFNYSKQDHNGLDMSSFEMLTVKDGKFTFYKKN
jgi:branched-chain amino acid transport system substrate-binding protein